MRPVHRSRLPVPGTANAWRLLGRLPDPMFLSGAGPDRQNSSCQSLLIPGQPAPPNRRSNFSSQQVNQLRSRLHRRHRQMLKLTGLLFLSGAGRDCGRNMARQLPVRTRC